MDAFRTKGASQGQEHGDRKVQKNEVGKDTHSEEDKEVKNVLLLVATLIATVSFAAGFTMPGGYQSEKGPNQGFAVLIRNAAFKAFVVTNTIAMIMSSGTVLTYLFMAILPLKRKKLHNLQFQIDSTFIALIAMVIAFITGTYAVLGSSSRLAIAVCVLGCYLFILMIRVLQDDA
ncbi:hypothetical protein M0R45_005845 [Rubus argutus]|uniref:PGG domain-containing protein n=1 Tax=Rubus argutus TaxID=59490 RepID=A0AAW1YPB8_RUBAR